MINTFYEIESNINKRIVLLADIHYYSKKMNKLLNKIVEKTSLLKPDYICISGDFIDQDFILDKEILLEFFANLGLIAPVLISIGNHELENHGKTIDKYDEELFNKIDMINNVHLLNNKSWVSDKIRFTGLNFPPTSYEEVNIDYSYTKTVLDTFFKDGLKKDKYNVVLSHSPYILIDKEFKNEKLVKSCDLILSGHVHGGLTPKWLCNLTKRVFVSPKQRLFVKNSYGYLKKYKTIVTSGITKLSHVQSVRMFNFLFSKEIVVIDLKEKDN